MAKHNIVGKTGEDIAEKWLRAKGYTICERNYRQKWGEIDLIVEKKNKICFVEVKTVSYETKDDLERSIEETSWRPEENVHGEKMRRLGRTIETWIASENYGGEWQIDVLAVRIVPHERYARIKHIPNVILE